MNVNLRLTYFGLLLTSLISSSLLFIVVASANAKCVAATETTSNAKLATNDANEAPSTTTNAQSVDAAFENQVPSSLDETTKEKIIPNYKKVKKLHKLAKIVSPTPALPVASVLEDSVNIIVSPPSDFVPLTMPYVAADNSHSLHADSCDRIGRVDGLSPPSSVADSANQPIVSKNGESTDKIITEVPVPVIKLDKSNSQVQQEAPESKGGDVVHNQDEKSLPNINDIPTMLVTEIPLELVQQPIIIDPSNEKTEQERENQTIAIDIPDFDEEMEPNDGQIIKINDSGGIDANIIQNLSDLIIPSENATLIGIPTVAGNETTNTTTTTTNQTAEEIPIPVFSEWAQKQMEAAEKQQALEQEVVNTSTLKKNHTNGNGKSSGMKMRAKNYASPDCGSKIIASNADATNTGALLSSSKDEYMLSPCGARIWFVVELCEAIQAQKVELANFELFSSSPKNFTVAVSNRFPSREWSNVGRFAAEDKRTVQSFNLHPHLFGKFVRVDIHSHYAKEHFCPLSLFRVFGTSEFEAFETENHPHGDLDDDDDDEFGLEQAHVKNSENNLFKSASDAVLSIVKKAAEVLVKPTSSQNQSEGISERIEACQTYAFGKFSCANCNATLVDRINHVLSCKFKFLYELFQIQEIRYDLIRTQVCAKQYGMEAIPLNDDDCSRRVIDVNQSYLLSLISGEFIGALCHLETAQHTMMYPRKVRNESELKINRKEDVTYTQNLTINKELNDDDLKIGEKTERPKAESPSSKALESEESQTEVAPSAPPNVTERDTVDGEQLPPSAGSAENVVDVPMSVPEVCKENTPDINIYNIPSGENIEAKVETTITEIPIEESNEQSTTILNTIEPTTTISPKSEEDPNSWDSLENLLSPTAQPRLPEGTPSPPNGVGNSQPKISSSPQSESVFIRLSNRIKTLERNMSLSGQYLEELSRRYKKQVEELQQNLNQQTQTVRSLEEENRRRIEMEQLYAQRNDQMQLELDSLSLQIQACIVVIICVGTFVFLLLVAGIVFYRAMCRQQKALMALHGNKKRSGDTNPKKKQRKSYEECSDRISGGKSNKRERRPSEEAMLILCEGMASEKIGDSLETGVTKIENEAVRRRKISVYSNDNHNNVNSNSSVNGANNPRELINKRKGEKHSWPTGLPNNESLWPGNDKANKLAKEGKTQPHRNKENNLSNGGGHQAKNNKKSQNSKKLITSSNDLNAVPLKSQNGDEALLKDTEPFIRRDFDESLMLDDQDLDNYIPNTDLCYNEFMPEGPSAYQVTLNDLSPSNVNLQSEKPAGKKPRRLSSSGFFKSPFTKSIKLKPGNTPHESTSWEWYRLRKAEAQQNKSRNSPASINSNLGILPTDGMDSSSLSEINFSTNSKGNSFRILEEAILSSGESLAGSTSATALAKTNGNSHSGSSGGSSNQSTTSSSNSKKKSRSFNKIFRKVF